MGFSEYDRIRKKNRVYNYPDADTNAKACRFIRGLKSKGIPSHRVKTIIESELEATSSNTSHGSILKTALIILNK